MDGTSAKLRSGVTSYFRDVYSVLKDGIKRYEVAEPECQARIVCELHQRSTGRSFKTWANTLLDILGVEDYLESSTFGARTKSVMKDVYRAAKNGMIDKNCAEIYAKCPVSISSEPLRNTLFNKMIRGSGHNMMRYQTQEQHYRHQPPHHSQQQENVGKVYGPFAGQSTTAQNRESPDHSVEMMGEKQSPDSKSTPTTATTTTKTTARPSATSSSAVTAVNKLSSSQSSSPGRNSPSVRMQTKPSVQSQQDSSHSRNSPQAQDAGHKTSRSATNARLLSHFSSSS